MSIRTAVGSPLAGIGVFLLRILAIALAYDEKYVTQL